MQTLQRPRARARTCLGAVLESTRHLSYQDSDLCICSVLVFVPSYLDVHSNKSTVCGHSPSIGSQHSASPPYMVTRDEHSTSVPESRRNFIPTERFQIQSIPLGLLSPHIQQRNVVYQQSESAGSAQHCRRLQIPRITHFLGQPTPYHRVTSSHTVTNPTPQKTLIDAT